jgi:4-hydroxybenzoate polyprenyltransferase
MNKKADWQLSGILGFFGVILIILPLLNQLSKWWIILGVIFIVLAFLANKR